MIEPNTKAGRFLQRVLRLANAAGPAARVPSEEAIRDAILAIEREAAAPQLLDVPPEALGWARELVRQGYRDEHIVTFTEDGYGLEHPIRCRPNLTGCMLNEWLRTQMAPDCEPGRYVMEWDGGGPEYTPAKEGTR